MKVLVVGSGGREHALAWKLASDPEVSSVVAAPGSAGIAQVADCVAVGSDDIRGLASLAAEVGADLTVVGPEAPLAAGIGDAFRAEGLSVFGPGADGAQLESSKAFTKALLVEAGVPTAAYRRLEEPAEAKAFAHELGYPVVVKADGLAAGKGVVICADQAQADAAIDSMLVAGRFGEAGRAIVVEEFLRGEEASFMALTDGKSALSLAASQDHKAVFDGDRGPNTGGMGAYSPAPVVDAAMAERVHREVIEPTVEALQRRGIDFHGVLYAGLMIENGVPRVLEYNVRFGDPECQALMMRLDGSLAELARACVEGTLHRQRAAWTTDCAACVVMASEGYPGAYPKDVAISGIEEAAALDGVQVFHAGTRRDDQGTWRTAGGRVLGVAARAADMRAAVDRAYEGVGRISWAGAHYRKDIAHRAFR